MLFIGADGGGTQTTLIACDETGKQLAACQAPGVNYNAIGMEKARENLHMGVSTLLHMLDESEYTLLCVGLSALDGPATEAETAAFAGDVFDAQKLLLLSDAYVGLVGATDFAPGMMIISGTGSMGTALDDSLREVVAGGFGYLLGDAGSGFAIGKDAFLAAASAEEHGRKTALLALVRRHCNVSNLRSAIPALYKAPFSPSVLASLAKEVDLAAEQGDWEAKAILEQAGKDLAALVFSLAAQGGRLLPIYCYGSVITRSKTVQNAFSQTVLAKYPTATIGKPRLSPAEGALLCAAAQKKVLNWNNFAANLHKTRQGTGKEKEMYG